MEKSVVIGYGLLALTQMGFEKHVLDEFESELRYIMDTKTEEEAYEVYNNN